MQQKLHPAATPNHQQSTLKTYHQLNRPSPLTRLLLNIIIRTSQLAPPFPLVQLVPERSLKHAGRAIIAAVIYRTSTYTNVRSVRPLHSIPKETGKGMKRVSTWLHPHEYVRLMDRSTYQLGSVFSAADYPSCVEVIYNAHMLVQPKMSKRVHSQGRTTFNNISIRSTSIGTVMIRHLEGHWNLRGKFKTLMTGPVFVIDSQRYGTKKRPLPRQSRCGLCGDTFQHWKEGQSHISNHFRSGIHMRQ